MHCLPDRWGSFASASQKHTFKLDVNNFQQISSGYEASLKVNLFTQTQQPTQSARIIPPGASQVYIIELILHSVLVMLFLFIREAKLSKTRSPWSMLITKTFSFWQFQKNKQKYNKLVQTSTNAGRKCRAIIVQVDIQYQKMFQIKYKQ